MSLLATDKLSCGYGHAKSGQQVLESISLEVQPGEVLVLLGPNGAGKTTLLRALARSAKPLSGKVLLEGRDLWSYSARQSAQHIALMPQNERRDWPLTVEESIRLGRSPHRGWMLPFNAEDDAIVEQALESSGLDALRGRPITQLSGGEWRRMIFARALAQQASILLLDEPTSGLDLKYQHEILQLSRDLARNHGLTFVITLHDLNLAALYGDRLAILAERSIVAIGRAPEVLTPQLIYSVFGVRATIVPHPVYGTPLVVPLMDARPQGGSEGKGENEDQSEMRGERA